MIEEVCEADWKELGDVDTEAEELMKGVIEGVTEEADINGVSDTDCEPDRETDRDTVGDGRGGGRCAPGWGVFVSNREVETA